jgi:hypothetical protein
MIFPSCKSLPLLFLLVWSCVLFGDPSSTMSRLAELDLYPLISRGFILLDSSWVAVPGKPSLLDSLRPDGQTSVVSLSRFYGLTPFYLLIPPYHHLALPGFPASASHNSLALPGSLVRSLVSSADNQLSRTRNRLRRTSPPFHRQ